RRCDGNSLASFLYYIRKQVNFPVEYKSTKTIIQEGNHLSISHNIRNLIDIQDTNIFFEDNCVKKGQFKGIQCKYVTGKLTYDPTHCENCGIKNIDYLVYKNGTEQSRITIPISGITPTYLYLKKQRFFCKSSEYRLTAKTSIVTRECFISEHSITQVVIKCAEAQPILSFGRDCSVSTSTVQRLITQDANTYKAHHTFLPDHLSFDDFKYAAG